jgi:hypothetical protein
MSAPGMWMPKQNYGKQWIVNYSVVMSGDLVEAHRKFRVKADASEFVKEAKETFAADSRIESVKFEVSKI